mmetsp:Transcript_51281/g.158908  ORF Transcript_51281/g.158908 Transcript_51281/m.158908 type:complete len:376 (-) Transcript_51281:340-1467(-)
MGAAQALLARDVGLGDHEHGAALGEAQLQLARQLQGVLRQLRGLCKGLLVQESRADLLHQLELPSLVAHLTHDGQGLVGRLQGLVVEPQELVHPEEQERGGRLAGPVAPPLARGQHVLRCAQGAVAVALHEVDAGDGAHDVQLQVLVTQLRRDRQGLLGHLERLPGVVLAEVKVRKGVQRPRLRCPVARRLVEAQQVLRRPERLVRLPLHEAGAQGRPQHGRLALHVPEAPVEGDGRLRRLPRLLGLALLGEGRVLHGRHEAQGRRRTPLVVQSLEEDDAVLGDLGHEQRLRRLGAAVHGDEGAHGGEDARPVLEALADVQRRLRLLDGLVVLAPLQVRHGQQLQHAGQAALVQRLVEDVCRLPREGGGLVRVLP